MPTQPIVISNKGAEASPNTYVVPSSLAFDPTAITALFNGASAASSFLACLTFYSSDGLILGRTFPSETLNAGDSAEVTYSPFVGGLAASPLALTIIGAYVQRPNGTPQAVTSSFAFDTTITFTSEIFDTVGMFDPGTPTRLTIQQDGVYLVAATGGMATNASGGRGVGIFKNATTLLIANQTAPPTDFFWGGSCTVVSEFVAGDFIELRLAQHSGGNLNTGDCWLSCYGVGTV